MSADETTPKRKPYSNHVSHVSRRRIWIQKKWKRALKVIKSSTKFDVDGCGEMLTKDGISAEDMDDFGMLVGCNHEFTFTDKCKQCAYCFRLVNQNSSNPEGLRCQICRIIIHESCQPDLTSLLQKRSKHRSGTPEEVHLNNEVKNVDPVYLALKAANKMAAQRKQTDSSRNSSQTRDPTPTSSELTSQSSSSNSKLAVPSLSPNNSFLSPSSPQNPTTNNSKSNGSLSPSNHADSIHSASNLLLQKSVDSQEENAAARKTVQATTASNTPVITRHAVKVPPCQKTETLNNEISDSTAGNFTTWAVVHEYFMKFPEEIDLRLGTRVHVIDNSDQDWWQGRNNEGRVGIFPATCVSRIFPSEQVFQIVQNVCLNDGQKTLRLYRDQVCCLCK